MNQIDNENKPSESDRITNELKTKGYHYESGLITSKKIKQSFNAGNTLFMDPYEVTMSPIESFQHSEVCQAVGKVVEWVIYRAKTKVK